MERWQVLKRNYIRLSHLLTMLQRSNITYCTDYPKHESVMTRAIQLVSKAPRSTWGYSCGVLIFVTHISPPPRAIFLVYNVNSLCWPRGRVGVSIGWCITLKPKRGPLTIPPVEYGQNEQNLFLPIRLSRFQVLCL